MALEGEGAVRGNANNNLQITITIAQNKALTIRLIIIVNLTG